MLLDEKLDSFVGLEFDHGPGIQRRARCVIRHRNLPGPSDMDLSGEDGMDRFGLTPHVSQRLLVKRLSSAQVACGAFLGL